MLSRVHSSTISGLDGCLVEVEIDISPGLPVFSIVGLPDTAVKESRDRVRSAIKNSGYDFPVKKIIINLSPADVKKEGASFDLPIAIGILSAIGLIPREAVDSTLIIGELSLDGTVRKIKGTLSHTLQAKTSSLARIIVPEMNAQEAALVPDIQVYGVNTLAELVEFLIGNRQLDECISTDTNNIVDSVSTHDYSDVSGQECAKRAIEISAAGNHNLLMVGPPGSGKTMLAKRIGTILPPMTMEEALETSKTLSVMGILPPDTPLAKSRSFRSPHHTISDAGLIGGGHIPRPGEVTLAHNGILFLDELAEFSRRVLDVLRQPLEDGSVTISRASSSLTFPARFLLVGAMNPCPCGYMTDPTKSCSCSGAQIEKYSSKLSGPLLDRIDLHIEVPAVRYKDLVTDNSNNETSATIRKRVLNARKIQTQRFNSENISYNAMLHSGIIKKYCKIDKESSLLLEKGMDKLGLSARSYNKVLSVSRTIADLEGSEDITPTHIAEALQYRFLDRKGHYAVR